MRSLSFLNCLERNGKLNSRVDFGHHDFREFHLYSDGVILKSEGLRSYLHICRSCSHRVWLFCACEYIIPCYFSPLNVPFSATHSGNTTGSSSGLPSRFCSPILAPSFIVCVYLFLILNLLRISSDAAISRGRWAGDICQIDHLVDTRASILSTFTADLMLLALKLVGILRWKEARQKVGTWRLLYSEVSLPPLEATTLTVQLSHTILAIGIDMGCGFHAC